MILEDNPADVRRAADFGRRAGFTEIEISGFASGARLYLEKRMSEKAPLPDAIVVDLDLGLESGFELLRFWHGTAELRAIPVIIWTIMGDHEREICRLFGVQRFVSKVDGSHDLLEALGAILAESGDQRAELPA
jgi:DNA-binding response OmpR family regulator